MDELSQTCEAFCVSCPWIYRGRCCNAIAFSIFFYGHAEYFCQISRLSKLFEFYTNFCKYEVLWPHEDYHIQQRGAYRVQLITLSVYLIVKRAHVADVLGDCKKCFLTLAILLFRTAKTQIFWYLFVVNEVMQNVLAKKIFKKSTCHSKKTPVKTHEHRTENLRC